MSNNDNGKVFNNLFLETLSELFATVIAMTT